jgi:phosphoribosylformimino-5-aminoimidazole carboxamide ribonucleotide (ProFAR) isomerase
MVVEFYGEIIARNLKYSVSGQAVKFITIPLKITMTVITPDAFSSPSSLRAILQSPAHFGQCHETEIVAPGGVDVVDDVGNLEIAQLGQSFHRLVVGRAVHHNFTLQPLRMMQAMAAGSRAM